MAHRSLLPHPVCAWTIDGGHLVVCVRFQTCAMAGRCHVVLFRLRCEAHTTLIDVDALVVFVRFQARAARGICPA
eukprot:2228224-Alexandrium_andersonii.AAC.1